MNRMAMIKQQIMLYFLVTMLVAVGLLIFLDVFGFGLIQMYKMVKAS